MTTSDTSSRLANQKVSRIACDAVLLAGVGVFGPPMSLTT
jgi:hypothetical protein